MPAASRPARGESQKGTSVARKPRSPKAQAARRGPDPDTNATAEAQDQGSPPEAGAGDGAARTASADTLTGADAAAARATDDPEAVATGDAGAEEQPQDPKREDPAHDSDAALAPLPDPTADDAQPPGLVEPAPGAETTDAPAGDMAETTAQDRAKTPAEDTAGPATEGPAPTPAAAPQPPAPHPARGPGVLALLAGGVLAAVIGFGAARFVIPEGWPFGPVSQATRDLTQALDNQAGRIDALRADLDALPATLEARIDEAAAAAAESRVAALRDDLTARIDALTADLAALRDSLTRLDDFDARLTELERRPAAEGAASRAAIDSFERELAEMRGMLEQERARNAAAEAEIEERAQALRDEAAELARAAALDRAREQLSRALAEGGGFAGALGALEEAGVTPPEALRQHARTGVATLESLQEGFAEPARDALRATADSAPGEIGAFLRTQFGVRSLSPRAGDSADAILSRAEAAARAGDLGAALAELDALPPEGRAAMAGWIEAAQARKAVTEAAATLAQQ